MDQPRPSADHDHIAHQLLSSVLPSAEDADRIFAEKVKQKPLFLRPAETELADARERRRRERLNRKHHFRMTRQKPKPLSAKEKRTLNVYALDAPLRKYSIYEPLHRMWLGYAQELLMLGEGPGKQTTVSAQAAAKLTSADFHGALIEVVRARSGTRVGLKGIVVQDTKFTFQIITPKDEVKVIPKEHAIFRFEIPIPIPPPSGNESGPTSSPASVPVQADQNQPRPLVFELHGNQFQNRAVDRANKKFKQHSLDDL
ncbi:RNase P/MRP, p29 subunit [Xylona heveae TC161]|uniref:Ribonuclease P protein subunit n=1 Tax=Xylona heveae (strain CBS 132557 / TC161) TaxID=1328760 RepID=A0A165GEZ6_XYLHT|nr:RNase P/MRP, p29 subunit [Xylona heveae TC161]KZF22106.1 RNase P/MRP, p29 subunit [Xylona heveae TC161]